MNTTALITMLVTQISVAFATIYFFVKVLKAPIQKVDNDVDDE